MNKKQYPIVLIGGSIASISFIRTLRQEKNTEKVLLVYGEDRLPYKRTKINKNMVRGFSPDEFLIADEQWYADNNVELINGWVTRINPGKKYIGFGDGQVFHYGKLLLATGAAAVMPQVTGIKPADLHGVQNISDVERLMHAVKEKQRCLIIGAGVEGIETADQLVRKGKEVVIAGRMDYPLQKLFPKVFIQPLLKAMEERGVKFHSGLSVDSISCKDGKYHVLMKGLMETFDVVVSCAGTKPNASLARESGLTVDRGIVVDQWMRSSDADIMAAGDVAQHGDGSVTGLWHAAEHQGYLAARNLYGNVEPHILPPFRLKTEVFNLYLFSAAYNNLMPDGFSVSREEGNGIMRWMYYRNNKLEAVLMLNDGERARDYQLALMEKWPAEKVAKELPITAPLSFNFSPVL